jgi:hypothetical protein
VRQGPWKLTGQGTKTKTLIHLSEDLSESKNLHSTHPDRVSALHKLHQQWVKEVGAR